MGKVFDLEKITEINKEMAQKTQEEIESRAEEAAVQADANDKASEEAAKQINISELGEVNIAKEKEDEITSEAPRYRRSLIGLIYDRLFVRENRPILENVKEFDKIMEQKEQREAWADILRGESVDGRKAKTFTEMFENDLEAVENMDEFSHVQGGGFAARPQTIADFEKAVNAMEDSDRKFQAQQVLFKAKTLSSLDKIDLTQFDLEKDSAEKIQLTLQGQLKFGKEQTQLYKNLSADEIKVLRSIQIMRQEHPDKISQADISGVASIGDANKMKKAIIKIAQKEGIEKIPNIRVTNEMVNDTIYQKVDTLDSKIKSFSKQNDEQAKDSKSKTSPSHDDFSK